MLCVHKDPEKYLNLVDRYFRLRNPPECPIMYLGVDIRIFLIPNGGNGVTYWYTRADIHVNKSLQVFESKFKEDNDKCKSSNITADHPLSSQSYRTELDINE